VVDGGGSVTPSSGTTSADGTVQAVWTLGPGAGAQTLRLAAGSLAPVLFHATGTAGPPVAVLKVAGDAQMGAVAAALSQPLAVRVEDANGNPVSGWAVAWEVAAGGGAVSVATSLSGTDGVARASWTLGTKAGSPQSVVAHLNGASASIAFAATALAGPTAVVTVSPAALTLRAGDSARLTASAVDAYGNVVSGRPIAWSSATPLIALVDSVGRVASARPGPVRITATVEGKSGSAALAVLATTPPKLDSISPDRIYAGLTVTIVGSGFSPVPAGNDVVLGGVSLTVTSASETRLQALIPNRSTLPCLSVYPALVTVTVPDQSAAVTHDFATSLRVDLAKGEDQLVRNDAIGCMELPPQAGSYFMSVVDVQPSGAAPTAFRLVGRGTGPGGTSEALFDRTGGIAATLGQAPAPAVEDPLVTVHARVRSLSDDVIEQLGSPHYPAPGPQPPVPSVGDTMEFSYPSLHGSSAAEACTVAGTIHGRVVYAGAKVVAVEDRSDATAGRLDDVYLALAQDYESSALPLLQGYGDLFALDAALGGRGRVVLLFSHRVADDSVPAFVLATDLYPRAACASSNAGEVLYAAPPGAGPVGGVQSQFPVRALHESYHLLSDAEHLARRGPALHEGEWLSEALAQTTAELWARRSAGLAQGRDLGFFAMRCEFFCQDAPAAMTELFRRLYSFMLSSRSASPFLAGAPYGPGWALVRWTLDQYATDELGMLRALTQERTDVGITNLEGRSGHVVDELLGGWSLAMALDDGGVPARAALAFPSWNLPDVMGGLNAADPGAFPYTSPLAGWTVNAGDFTITTDRIVGGAAQYFLVRGVAAAPQVLQVLTVTGTSVPPALRVAIVRTQ
jgi:hypothetical protein